MNLFPTTKELKLRARHSLAGAFGPCLTAALVLTLVTYVLTQLLQRSGGAINLYFWDPAVNDIPSSLSLSSAGLFTALRVEEAGMGISLAVTPDMLLKVFALQLLCAALAAPLRLGCHRQLWAAHRGAPTPMLHIFAPYTDLRQGGQAVVLEVILTAIHLLLQGILFVPALLLLQAMGPTMNGFVCAMWTMLLGMVVAWCLMTPFLPARFLLAREQSTTALGALRDGFTLLRGVTGRFLRFRLSFAVWEICSALSNGVFDIYLFPYRGLSTLAWIAAREDEMRDTACTL